MPGMGLAFIRPSVEPGNRWTTPPKVSESVCIRLVWFWFEFIVESNTDVGGLFAHEQMWNCGLLAWLDDGISELFIGGEIASRKWRILDWRRRAKVSGDPDWKGEFCLLACELGRGDWSTRLFCSPGLMIDLDGESSSAKPAINE